MRIIIHHVLDVDGNVIANHVLHTDVAPWNMIAHPTIADVKISIPDFLALCDKDPLLKAAAGYMVHTNVPDKAVGTTRWDLIREACSTADVEPALKALALK